MQVALSIMPEMMDKQVMLLSVTVMMPMIIFISTGDGADIAMATILLVILLLEQVA